MKIFIFFLFNLVCTNFLFAQFGSEQVITDNSNGARAVFSIDLDGDNDNDLLLASENDNKIAWFENLGNHAFSSENLIVDDILNPVSVFAIDLDGDGDNDVLSANYGDNTIAWFENLGGGVFSSQNTISNNSGGASSVYAIDLDSDGDNDVIEASFTDGQAAWFENLGNGIFGTRQVLSPFNGSPRQVFVTDLDGDNDPDILLADALNDITWFENLGAGSFGGEQIIGSIFYLDDVYAGDLDNDGDADIIASGSYNRISFYENNGEGLFGEEQVVSDSAGGAFNIYLFDLNGDDLLDILSAERSLKRLVWYENLGSLTFSVPNLIANYPADDNIRDVYAADLDSDGDLDIVAPLFSEGKMVLFENTGTNTFVEDHELSEAVKVYPNPSGNLFTLELNQSPSALKTITITNTEGRIINARIDVQEEQMIIDLGNEASGIYYLNLMPFDGKPVGKKIVFLK